MLEELKAPWGPLGCPDSLEQFDAWVAGADPALLQVIDIRTMRRLLITTEAVRRFESDTTEFMSLLGLDPKSQSHRVAVLSNRNVTWLLSVWIAAGRQQSSWAGGRNP